MNLPELARLAASQPPTRPITEMSGRELFGEVMAGAERKRAAQAELDRRLRARGDLDARGDIRADKCFDCGEICGTPLTLHRAERHAPREADSTRRVLDNLRGAGVRLPGIVDALLRAEVTYTAAVKAVDGWPANGEGKTLVLLGDTGCGKTWAACAVLAQASGLFLRAAELGRPMPDDQRHRALYHSGVVVVDDLGLEHVGASEYALSVIDELVTTRHDCGRATLLTSNLTGDCARETVRCGKCMRDRYGERLWSRARKVEVGGKDLRR